MTKITVQQDRRVDLLFSYGGDGWVCICYPATLEVCVITLIINDWDYSSVRTSCECNTNVDVTNLQQIIRSSRQLSCCGCAFIYFNSLTESYVANIATKIEL